MMKGGEIGAKRMLELNKFNFMKMKYQEKYPVGAVKTKDVRRRVCVTCSGSNVWK